MWVVDVMDFEPEARERTFKVTIVAEVQPVPPSALKGTPVRPVVLEGLVVTPYMKKAGNGRSKIAYSLRARAWPLQAAPPVRRLLRRRQG